MASLIRDSGGRKRIQFIDREGERKAIRLGKVSQRMGETVLDRVEKLVEASIEGSAHSSDLAEWVASLPPVLHRRLVRAGLVAPREGAAAEVTLVELIEKFHRRSSGKPATHKVYEQCSASLVMFFGVGAPLSAITHERADEYRSWLQKPHEILVGRARKAVVKPLAVATQSKRIEVARQIFARAVRWKMIEANPFEGVKAGTKVNTARMFYVSREATAAILEQCRSTEWKAIVGLARYAGLRVPSELIGLRWSDLAPRVSGGRRQMFLRVTSPKTAHHGAGHEERLVPVSSELLSILEQCKAAAEPGEDRIVPGVGDGSTNLRTEFQRTIARAGLEQWEKPFQNCRSSCECDWLEQFPGRIAAIARWMGHSPAIAMKHYAQVLPHHADGAAAEAPEWAVESAPLSRGALTKPKAAHFPAQQGAEMGGMKGQAPRGNPRHSREKPHFAENAVNGNTLSVGAT